MKTHDDLQEQYEESLFALLMDAVAEEEGKAALAENERLNSTGEISVPKEATKRNLALIDKCFVKEEVRKVGFSAGRILKRVALVAVVCALLFTTAFASVPLVRELVYEFLVEVLDNSTAITVGETLGYEMSSSPEITVNWVPEGYELVDAGTSDSFCYNVYKNTSNEEIVIDVYHITNGVLNLDTEEAVVQNFKINGYDTMLVMKENDNQVAIMNESTSEVCVIYSDKASADDLIKVAEGIEF